MSAVAFIDVSLATLIFYLHTLFVAVIGHFRGHSRLRPVLMILIAIALMGLAMVLGVTTASLNRYGVGFSVMGMIGAAVLIVLLADHARQIGPIAANFYMSSWLLVYLTVIILLSPFLGEFGVMGFPTSFSGWVSIFAAGVTITLGFVTFFAGVNLIGATRAVMISLSEPIFAILLAIVLVQEWLSLVQWVGVFIIVGSLYLFELFSKPATGD